MTKKALRILHVLNYSLPYISGYCSRSHYILKAQQRAGMEVAVVTSPRHLEMYPESAGEEQIDGIRYVRTMRAPRAVHSLLRVRAFTKSLEEQISRTAAEFRPALIHAHSPSLCGIPAQKVAKRLGVPFVYEVRALWEDAAVDQGTMKRLSWKYFLSRYAETRLLTRSDAAVVLCEPLKREIDARTGLGDRIIVVPNGVDNNMFVPRPRNIELARSIGVQNNTVVGFVGTFFRFEGLDDLVRVWDGLAANNPDARLVLVGYGEVSDTLERLRSRIGNPASIILPGRVPHNKVLDYYSIMDIMVYPRKSLRLTELVTPLKPLEAMSMGKPVVASDVGGLRDLIEHNVTGLLFQTGNDAECAASIQALIGDSGLRAALGARARDYIARERTWDGIIDRYTQLYHMLCG